MKHKPTRQQKKVAKGYSSPEPDIQDSSGSEGKNIYYRLFTKLLKGYYCKKGGDITILCLIYEKYLSYLNQEVNVGVWRQRWFAKKAILGYR